MQKDIWIFIFSVAFLCLNWPFLEIFQNNFAQYLFVAWLVIIAVVFNVTYKMEINKNTKKRGNRGG